MLEVLFFDFGEVFWVDVEQGGEDFVVDFCG